MAATDKTHIRHSLLFLFDAIEQGRIRAPNESETVVDWITAIYGEGMISTNTVKIWFRRFRSGDRSLEDKPRSGRPTEIDDAALLQELKRDSKQSTGELALKFGVSDETVRRHLNELGHVWKLGRWVHKELGEKRKLERVEKCKRLLDCLDRGELKLDELVTGDETWVMYNNVVRPHHWLPKGEKAPPTPKAGSFPKKVQLCVWWGLRGVYHWELLPQGASLNAERHCGQLGEVNKQLRHGPLREKHAYKKTYSFLHDGASCHRAKLTQEKLAELRLDVLDHPADSPDVAPTDYHFNLSLKNYLRGKKFSTETEIREAIQKWIDSRPAQFFRDGIEELPARWREVVDMDGECLVD